MAYLGREAAKAPLVTADIPDDSITSAKIVDATIAAGDLAANSVDSSELVDGSVDLSHMSSESVDEDNLHISNAGSNGEFLSKQSGNAGGLTWAAGGGGLVHVFTSDLRTDIVIEPTFNNFYDSDYSTYHVVFKDIEIAADSTEWGVNFNTTASGNPVEGGAGYWTAINGYSSNSGAYSLGLEGATSIRMCPNLGSATGEVFNGIFTLSGMQNTSVFASFTGSIGWNHGGDYTVAGALSGQFNDDATTLFSGFSLTSQSGNFAGGSISIYGYATS